MSSEFRPEPQDGFDSFEVEYQEYLASVESSEGWFYGLDISKGKEMALVDCFDI